MTDNGLGMLRPGETQPEDYFIETKGKQGGMNQAFYAVQERDDDICFASDPSPYHFHPYRAVVFDDHFKKSEDVRFYHFTRLPNDTKSLSNNDVHWIISTQQKELYLATFGGGLNKLVSIGKDGQGEFKSYSVLDGLSSDVLLSIREDRKHNLWISSENGICKFNPSAERFENYDEHSLSFRVRFSEASSVLTSDGNMLFGTSNGLFIFNPDSIRKSSYVPPIVFSRLYQSAEHTIYVYPRRI